MSGPIVLADGFTENPKMLALADKEFRLYICSIAMSHRKRTGGRISGEDLRELLAACHTNITSVNALVACECWEPEGDEGYRVHDYQQDDAPEGAKPSFAVQRDMAQQVYAAWRESKGMRVQPKETKADRERLKVIQVQLGEYPFEDVMDAVRGWVNDDWEERPRNNDVKLLLRNGTQLEKFRDLWRNPPRKKNWVETMKQRIQEGMQ